jgi:hypothetical protein
MLAAKRLLRGFSESYSVHSIQQVSDPHFVEEFQRTDEVINTVSTEKIDHQIS